MIARLWQTNIDPARSADYDAFAGKYSCSMFAALPGCLGAFFLGAGEVRSVLSLWTDSASIDALEVSTPYLETVTRFQATGILREPQTVKLFEVTGGTLNTLALAAELSRTTPNNSSLI